MRLNSLQKSQSKDLGSIEKTIKVSREEVLARVDTRAANTVNLLASQINDLRIETTDRLDHGLKRLALGQQLIVQQVDGLQKRLATVDKPPRVSSGDDGSNRLVTGVLKSAFPACGVACRCKCHSARHAQQLKFNAFRDILGSLTISYGGVWASQKPCNDAACRSQGSRSAFRLDYRIPFWVFQVIVTVSPFSWTSPEPLLRVARVEPNAGVHGGESLFGCVQRSDIEGARRILSARGSAVYDVNHPHGHTALRKAITRECYGMVKLLMDAGADPFHEDYRGVTAMEIAITHYHEGHENVNWLGDILPISMVMDESGYTTLHRIVLGMLHVDLATALGSETYQKQVNAKTKEHDTPLFLAATRGDLEAVQRLVAAGADVNLENKTGETPLFAAVERGSLEITRLLLDAGADVHHVCERNWDFQVMHVAAMMRYSAGDAAVMALLAARGAALHPVSAVRSTPMTQAALTDTWAAIGWLAARGGDVDWRDEDGEPPLAAAILRNNHRSAEALLGLGADYRFRNGSAHSVLHWLASSADERMMGIFRAAGMTGVDVEWLTDDGETAGDIFGKRLQVTPELEKAWVELLGSVSAAEKGCSMNPRFEEPEDSPDGASDDEFFDTVEHL
jgi:uncharacterized protein